MRGKIIILVGIIAFFVIILSKSIKNGETQKSIKKMMSYPMESTLLISAEMGSYIIQQVDEKKPIRIFYDPMLGTISFQSNTDILFYWRNPDGTLTYHTLDTDYPDNMTGFKLVSDTVDKSGKRLWKIVQNLGEQSDDIGHTADVYSVSDRIDMWGYYYLDPSD